MKQPAKLGNYEILRTLSAGGMGEVLLARKLGAGGFEKLVAIKTMRSELRDLDAVRTMFVDEAQLLARLEHPAVAQVHDFGEHDGALYLVMEYVAGVSFRELAEMGPPPGVVCRAVAQACRGLHAAHELTDLAGRPLQVVHRDVSPENLMLTFDGRVKVLDFGIALMRDRRAPVTEHGTIKGKPPYLAPEQIKNEAVDRRTDVFSTCVVLHELLTGAPLFQGGSVYAVARAIEHQDIAPPSQKAGPLLPGLDPAVLRGLARQPHDRYPTALALAEELERIADAAGAEPLDAFCARALQPRAQAHRRELQRLLHGEAPQVRARPTGAVTALAVSETALAAEPAPADSEPAPADSEPAPADIEPAPADIEPAARPGARKALGLAALGVAAAIAVGVAVTRTPATMPAAGQAPADARVVALVDPEPALIADAAAPRTRDPIDAGVAQPAPSRAREPAKPPAREPAKRPAREPAKPPAREPAKRPASPPSQTAQPDPPPRGFGYITVAADPFALVRIDGEDAGATPIFRKKLRAGTHEIELRSPDTGATRLRRSIDLAAGQTESIILK